MLTLAQWKFITARTKTWARDFQWSNLAFFECHIIIEEYFALHLLIFQNRYETRSVVTYQRHM
jgi:hypothetical protein